MANKDFKVKNGLDVSTPIPVSMGGTGQTSTSNALNSMLPSQSGHANKMLSTDGTNTTWAAQAVAYQRGGTASRPASSSAGDLYYNTDTNIFEQYTSLGWFAIAVAPGAPTGVTATNQPSGRAFNNGQMSVAFTPNTSAGAPSSFVVTPSPSTSPSTFTATSSPITVTNLASSTQYTYTVTASSAYGTSAASSASTVVTATTVPAAPTINSVTNGNLQASIAFTAGATGGSSITGFTVTSSPGSLTASGASSPLVVTGLTNGTSYTFTAVATNANGSSAASSASSSITAAAVPGAPTIGTATQTGATTATLTFTAPANNGGSNITSYTATSSPGSVTSTLNQAGSGTFNITGLTAQTTYTFTVTATNAVGTSSASSSSNSITTPSSYVIGGRGPGSGIIVYDAGSVLSWGRYIEVANSTSTPAWSDVQAQWSGNTSTVVSGATNTALGQGMISTLAIIAQDSTSNRAATLCRAYSGGGFTSTSNGWFLGSIGDWANMYSNKSLVQSTWQSGYYWGSSNNAANNLAWAIDMNSGSDPQQSKSSNHWVKPMRYFS